MKFKSFLKTIFLSSLIMLLWLSRKMYLCCTELKSDNRVLEAVCKYVSSLYPASSALSAWVSRTTVKSFHVGPRSSCNEKQILTSYFFSPLPFHMLSTLPDHLHVCFFFPLGSNPVHVIRVAEISGSFFTFLRHWHTLSVEICGHAVLAVLCSLATDVNRMSPVKKYSCK